MLLALALLLDINPPPPPPPPPAKFSGKVAFVNEKRGMIAVDLRTRDGISLGQRLRVLREGRRVGEVEVTDVQPWGSWVRVVEGQAQRGDRVVSP